MSGDSKFFIGVVALAVLVIGGIVLFSGDKQPADISEIDYSVGHKLGPDTAAVKIVEFGDFQCPACAMAVTDFENIQAENADSVQILFRHFPLPSHANGLVSSMAAEAAAKQNKFWEMYDLLYENQQQWEALRDPKATFVSFARTLELNIDQFEKDLSSNEIKEIVENDRDYGLALGVNQTPTFFINNKLVTGVQNIDNWRALVAEAKQ